MCNKKQANNHFANERFPEILLFQDFGKEEKNSLQNRKKTNWLLFIIRMCLLVYFKSNLDHFGYNLCYLYHKSLLFLLSLTLQKYFRSLREYFIGSFILENR